MKYRDNLLMIIALHPPPKSSCIHRLVVCADNNQWCVFAYTRMSLLCSLSVHDTLLNERDLFQREVGTCRYAAVTYYVVKVTFDALLLRLLPTVTYGLIVYWMWDLDGGAEKVRLVRLM